EFSPLYEQFSTSGGGLVKAVFCFLFSASAKRPLSLPFTENRKLKTENSILDCWRPLWIDGTCRDVYLGRCNPTMV
ncbi:MAG: hypothetical protein WAK96_14325, partial [Desulfobaccales bacterium]